MTVNRRKKDTRQRGSHTHGWGSKKKHRGSGNRGGKGMAGTGKRSDAIKPSIWKEEYFGKHGFTRPGARKRIAPVNIQYLDQNADRLVKLNSAKLENSTYIINLSDLGFDKLLGKGKVTKKLMLTAAYATDKAVKSVEDAGGKVTVAEARNAKAARAAMSAKEAGKT